MAARANAVQQNSFESLPLFIAAVLMAEYMVIPQVVVMMFGIAYIVLRIIYGICYLANSGDTAFNCLDAVFTLPNLYFTDGD